MKWQPPVKAPYLHTGGSKDGALDLSLAVAWLPDTCSIYQIEENIIDFSRHERLAENKHTIKWFSEGQGGCSCDVQPL